MRLILSTITIWLALWACGFLFGHPADSHGTQAPGTTEKAPAAQKQPTGAAAAILDPAGLLSGVTEKFSAANEYDFDGDLEVGRKVAGDYPNQILAKATVSVMVAPAGKYRIKVENGGSEAYSIVSDGQTHWTYVPDLKAFSQEPSVTTATGDVLDEFKDFQDVAEPAIIEKLSRLTVPIVVRLGKTSQSVYRNGSVLTVFSKNDSHEGQHMMYLTIAPNAEFERLVWMKAMVVNNEKVLVRSDIRVRNLRIGSLGTDSDFRFTPPSDAKRTDHLVIPSVLPKESH